MNGGTETTRPSGFYTVFVQHYDARGQGRGRPAKYASNMTWREADEAVKKLRNNETVFWAFASPKEDERGN